ncbi:MAG: nicotinamide-nucleotide amidohydrolase family protein [Clostridia bacterium]|nr:nicotinamide-nucleotide amidohydrolase family protein [Clostridia bacterium]
MNCEIITIGDEYLYGKADLSAVFHIYDHINGMGFNVDMQTIIASDMNQFMPIFNTAMRRSQLIVIIGGFSNLNAGTSREIVAKALSIPLVHHPKIERMIQKQAETSEDRFFNAYASLAKFPKNSTIFPNEIGLVRGTCIDVINHKILVLPGNTHELEQMFTKYVVPHIEPLRNTACAERKICLFGTDEDAVLKRLKATFETQSNHITTVQKGGCTIINLRVRASKQSTADSAADKIVTRIKNMFFDYVCSSEYTDLAKIVVDRLIKENKKIATAESCTAGMLSQRLTDVAGSSKIFEFGISAYSNRIKIDALGVPSDTIERYGAISEQTAILMAKNAREMSDADIGVGITGVTGPDKCENKDVGTIYIAVADKNNGWVRLLNPAGITDREQLRILSCNTALDLVRRYLVASADGVLKDGFDIHDLSHIKVLQKNPSLKNENKSFTPTQINASDALSDEEITRLLSSHIYDSYDDDFGADDTESLISHTENNFLLDEEEPESENDGTPVLEPKYDMNRFLVDDDAEEDSYNPNNIKTVISPSSIPLNIEFSTHSSVPKGTKRKQKGFFSNFVSFVFPNDRDSALKNTLKVLSLVLILIFIVASCIIAVSHAQDSKNTKILNSIREEWNTVCIDTGKTDSVFNSFNFLRQINDDTIGWLRINNSPIDYPVMLTDNNEFYYNHNIYKDKSRYGTIFADSSVIIEPTKISQNITLYGNTFSNGSMFSELKNYRGLDYYKNHPTISFKTLYRDNVYKIFSVFIINTDPGDDNSYAFEFAKSAFADKADFMAFVEEAKLRSILKTPVDVKEQDELLTLCVDTNEFKGAKLVVMARRTRSNENFAVDTRLADVNPNPIYPAIWYELKGLSMPNTTSLIDSAKNPSGSDSTSTDLGTSSDDSSSSDESSSSSQTSSRRPTSNTTTSKRNDTTTSKDNTSDTSSETTSLVTTSSDDSSQTVTTTSETTTTSVDQGGADDSQGATTSIPTTSTESPQPENP